MLPEMSETHPLPPLYARWLDEALPTPLPSERGATCDACAMCPQGDTAPTSLYVFDPEVKCCVYMPQLPNFLVGRALDEPGGHTVEARIAARIGLTPVGLARPAAYDLLHRGSTNAIGRSRSLRCPHFIEDGGRCGIWQSRDALCSTWFCKHERGALGLHLWQAVRDLLVTLEHTLAWWAAREQGIPVEVLAKLLPSTEHDRSQPPPPDGPAVDDVPDETVLASLWGAHHRKEADYYRACTASVAPLGWAEVLAIGGPDLAIRADLLRERLAGHAHVALPEALRIGTFEIAGQRPGGVRVVTYSSLDALDLPNALIGVLPAFDGRPTRQVLDELRDTWGIEIDPPLLQRLVDWGILVTG